MEKLLVRLFVKDPDNIRDPSTRSAYGALCGMVGIIANFFLFIIKFIAGTLTRSVSLTADAVNNLTDASSSIVNYFGFKLAAKPADDEHPYGHGRYEYLSALTVSIMVLLIGVETLKSGLDKILHPQAVDLSVFSVSTLIISVIVKLWLMFFNKKIGKKIESTALFAVSQDSRNDVITSSAVLLSAIISKVSGFDLDGFMGTLVALFILYSGIGLLRDAISPMLGTPPDNELVDRIKEKIMAVDGVCGTHDLIIHDYGPGRQFASVHVEMSADEPVLDAHDKIDNLERDIANELGIFLTVHYDPIVLGDSHLNEIRSFIEQTLSTLDYEVSVHDMRIVPGKTHTNVIFDCVLPRNAKMSESEFKAWLSQKVLAEFESHYCVITIDRAFTTSNY